MVILQENIAIGLYLPKFLVAVIILIATGISAVIYRSLIKSKYKETKPSSSEKAKYMFVSGSIAILLVALLLGWVIIVIKQ